jgi:hypothetical protein
MIDKLILNNPVTKKLTSRTPSILVASTLFILLVLILAIAGVVAKEILTYYFNPRRGSHAEV